MDMCIKSEPEDQYISHPQYCSEVQGFGAEEMGSELHLDADHIKSEIVTIKIMEENDLQQQYSTAEGFCPPPEQLNSFPYSLCKQYTSETANVKVQQHSKLQQPSCTENEINSTGLQVPDLGTCPFVEQCKSETDEVKTDQDSQSEGSFSIATAVNEAVDDLLQSNSVKVENSLNITGDHVQTKSFLEQSVVPVTSAITDKVSKKSCHDGVTCKAQKWQCHQCGNVLKSQSQLKVHLQMHSEDKYCCIQCGSTFSQVCQLKQHQLVHSGKAPYKCSVCAMCFARRSGLKKHQFLHSGEEPYTCSECGKSFSRGYTLKLHQRIHSGEKPFQCSQCGKSFSQGGHLKVHQFIHSGEKPYQCSQCGKSFSQGHHLKEHQRIHSGEKPYKCSQCGKSFSYLGNLKQHQLVHSGEKPYKCSECGQSFSHGGTLKEHQFLHSGEKPYKCSECGKHFSYLRTLKKHQFLHSDGKPY